MQIRKDPLTNNYYYHIYSRSIAKYVIFNDREDFSRMLNNINLLRYCDFKYEYSKFSRLNPLIQNSIIENLKEGAIHVKIIAYCLMPTHIHLILKQTADQGISKYMAKVLNSYAKFFNLKHRRLGPLWEGRFKSVLVSNDQQMFHLTQYIHLNPTSLKLVEKPEGWQFSSCREYIDKIPAKDKICSYDNLFDCSSKEYQKLLVNRKSYQQKLSQIKNLLIDCCTS